MKKLLALFLAVAMVAAGNVLALAEEAPAEEALITIDGCKPNETIRKTWSIYAPNNSQGLLIETEQEILSYENSNSDISVKDELRGDEKLFIIRLNNPLTSEEDVGKTIEDVIKVTLKNGTVCSFPLTITYRGGAKLEVAVNQWDVSHFVLGEVTSIPMTFIDPKNTFALPFEVKVEQVYPNGDPCPVEEHLLEIGEVIKSEKTFTIQVTPIKVGFGNIAVFVTDANGATYGKGWDIEISADGNFTDRKPFVGVETEGPTDNAANSSETTDAIREATDVLSSGTGELPKNAVSVSTASGATMTAIPVKLSSGSAALSLDTANTLGDSSVALSANVDNGAMEVVLPGGFGQINEPGRIYFPLDLNTAPSCAEEMKAAVKGDEDTRTEAIKAGGDMTLPATATITLKTKLEGTVNVYYYNEDTRRFTKLATTSAKEGKVTFATKQMGHLVLTTGTI